MAGYKCPKCGIGVMRAEVLPKHATNLNGVRIDITNASISRCSNCGEITVRAKELKRWANIQREAMAKSGQLPGPDEVKRLREAISLSVSDFAILVGVTRQTVHTWERPDSPGIGLGPAAMLLVLIRDELQGRVHGALDTLARMASLRGHKVNPRPSGPNSSTQSSSDIDPPALRTINAGSPGFYCGQSEAA